MEAAGLVRTPVGGRSARCCGYRLRVASANFHSADHHTDALIPGQKRNWPDPNASLLLAP
jgi:hypothetical protein